MKNLKICYGIWCYTVSNVCSHIGVNSIVALHYSNLSILYVCMHVLACMCITCSVYACMNECLFACLLSVWYVCVYVHMCVHVCAHMLVCVCSLV